MIEQVGDFAAFEHYREVDGRVAYFSREGECVFVADDAGALLNIRGNFLAMHGAWSEVEKRYHEIVREVESNPDIEVVLDDLAIVKTGVISLGDLNGMLHSNRHVMLVCNRLHRNTVRAWVDLVRGLGLRKY
jgi:hypothetical protein